MIRKKSAKMADFWRKFRLLSTPDRVVAAWLRTEGNIRKEKTDEMYLVPTNPTPSADAKTPDPILDQMFLYVN